MPHCGIGGLPSALEFLEAQLVDHKFHAGLVPVFPITEGIEYLNDGFDTGNQLLHRGELSEQLGNPRCGTQPSTRNHTKSDDPVRTLDCQQTDVVNRREGTVVRATGKRNLKLTRQALIQGIPQQVVGNRLCIGCHIEHLTLADAGQVAGRHISYRICTSLASGQADFSKTSHDGRHIFQLNKVHLNILPGCDMTDTRRVAVCQFCHAAELVRSNSPERNLDPHHLDPRLTLTINAVL